MDWMQNVQMNLLIDYYTEVPFRPYGSGCTLKEIVQWLRRLDLGYVCIYAKGHGGRTTWRSSLGTAHVRLARDMPRLFRQATREAGCKLILYYSGLLDGLAGDRHPEWRMRNIDGTYKARFGGSRVPLYEICPQSDYFEKWVAIHIREMLRGYAPDGIWVDGDWPGPCYCQRCRSRFLQETGDKRKWDKISSAPDFTAAYARTWSRIEHEWRSRFKALVTELKQDCVYSAGNVSPRREFLTPFDWRSGDFFSPQFFYLHDIARMMRWYGTLGIPYDAYICDTSFTHTRKDVRSRTKTLDRMMQEAATVASNGGVVGYWTYPLGNGALVPSRMAKAFAVRRFLREREELFVHTKPVPITAIVTSDPSTPTFGGDNGAGAHKALAALHQSPSLMDETGIHETMPYDLVVLPEQEHLDAQAAERLVGYVSRGGKLLTSGSTIKCKTLRSYFGVRQVITAAVRDGHVRLKICAEPTGVASDWDKLVLSSTRELYPLYLSWDQLNHRCRELPANYPLHGQLDEDHPRPAGFAAAVFCRLGKGMAVHVCTDVFAQYNRLGDPQMLRWIREILAFLNPQPYLTTTAPVWIDISVRRKNGCIMVHFVNQNPGRDVVRVNSDDMWVDEIPEVGPFLLTLRQKHPPVAVEWQPNDKKIVSRHRAGRLTVEIPTFQIHGCLVVKPDKASIGKV